MLIDLSQKEKEDLDDVFNELELADEAGYRVLYVCWSLLEIAVRAISAIVLNFSDPVAYNQQSKLDFGG